MAQPPGDETRPYSPSKLTSDTPLFIQTPSSGPLNNSGTYHAATTGPIVADGYGQPRLREDGQAYWDDSKPTPNPIIIDSSSPDSRMNSPESEEPTVPAVDTTQVGPSTMQAMAMALDNVPEHASSSQGLWDNVPSLPSNLPADLPPQPEVIEVRGRQTSTSRTPHAIKTGMLPDPFDPDNVPINQLPPPEGVDDDWDNALNTTRQDLADELVKDVVEQAIGWGAYTLVDNLDLRKVHDLPFDGHTIHALVAATLLILDAGGAKEEGETVVAGLTPSSWTRLLLGLLAAAIRGALRSPSYVTRSTKLLNWRNDTFPIQAELDRPLTEVGAIVLMCQQLGGLFESNANHTRGRGYPRFPDSYFERLTRTILRRIDRFKDQFPPLPSLPSQTLRLDEAAMAQITASVKDGIFADLNAQALDNADEWCALYKHEFVEAMHAAFEAQYPGIHLNKGKARAVPPITTSQVVRDAQPRIQAEVQEQVNARIKNIHNEIQDSLAAEEPFWKQGPLRDAIANTVRSAAQKEAEDMTTQEIAEMKAAAENTVQQMCQQLEFKLNQDIERMKVAKKAKLEVERMLLQEEIKADVAAWKAGTEANLKEWKVHHQNIWDLSGVKYSAKRLGYMLIPAGPPSRECVALDAPLNVLEVFRAFRAVQSVLEQLRTALNTYCNYRCCTENLGPASPLQPYPDTEVTRTCPEEYYTVDLPAQTALPPPPPTPMEEDLDYSLEVTADAAVANNGGLEESIHAPLTQPITILAHNPSVPPRATLLDALSEGSATAPTPLPLTQAPTQLADLVQVPTTAANDGLAVLIASLNATINRIEGTLTTRLDAQDKRIETMLKSRDPRPKPQPSEANRTKGKAVVAATPDPPIPSTSGPRAMDETLAHVAWVDDPAMETPEEIITEGAANVPAPSAPTVTKSSFQPPPDKVVPLTTTAQGKPAPSANMPPSWATLTKAGITQQQKTASHASAVKQGTGRSTAGKARPETVARRNQSGNTEAMVIRRLGIDNIVFELLIRKMHPTHIVAETRGEVERLSGGKVILLSGRWSQHAKAHNFVYMFKGDVPFEHLYPLRDILTKPLHMGHLVPNDGWTHAQLRNVATSDTNGVIPTPSQLETEIWRNPAFEHTIFCITPHWAGSLHNIANKPRGTVNMAYVDEKGTLTGKARTDGVFMYNERTNYVVTGDTPTIILCIYVRKVPSHWPRHRFDSLPAPCKRDHAIHCPNPHDKVRDCHCRFRCINCGQNHNARSPYCRMKMGFSPPPLAPHPSHTPQPATPSAKGKAKQTASHPVEELVPSQREPPSTSADDADQQGFVEVQRGKHRRNRGKKAAVQAANAAVPSASTASNGPKKITSPIPARPVRKELPTPPTWQDLSSASTLMLCWHLRVS
ncbi:hypothetical protein EDB89DRAFT_1912312 [Lactarius sanguifluus]|nr:hypothetical protein EDB89DRAFT_1912312 [Lactarius sanguifluus]